MRKWPRPGNEAKTHTGIFDGQKKQLEPVDMRMPYKDVYKDVHKDVSKDVHKDVYKVYILGNNPRMLVAKAFSLGSVRIDRHFIPIQTNSPLRSLEILIPKTTSPN